MGDIIHTLPALTDAGNVYPDITFDWMVEENFAEIPAWHKLVNKVIPIALRRWRSFYSDLKSEQYDFIIDAQGLIKSAVLTRIAHGMRCGMDKNSAREPLAAFFYQRKFSISKDQHAITRIRQLFSKTLNYEIPCDPPDYGIDIVGADPRVCPYIVFIHGTSRKDKLWPEENWIALAKLAAKYPIKIPWHTDEEHERAKRIAGKCKNVEILPKTNLTTLKNILSAANGVIAVDTGLGHLAAALGVPTISLYGPTDPKLIGTVGKSVQHLITKTPGIVDISVDDVPIPKHIM